MKCFYLTVLVIRILWFVKDDLIQQFIFSFQYNLDIIYINTF